MTFNRNAILVRQEVPIRRITDVYSLLDPATQQLLGEVREEPTPFNKWFRFLLGHSGKFFFPTEFNLYESNKIWPTLTIKKRGMYKTPNFEIYLNDCPIAFFKRRVFTLKQTLDILDPVNMQPFAQIKGKWTGWTFNVLDVNNNLIAIVKKKWGGMGKELFTVADTYMVALKDETSPNNPKLLAITLAAAIAFDSIKLKSR